MGNDRMLDVISFMLIFFIPPRYRITHAMAKVHSRIPKPNAGKGRRKQHISLRLGVLRIPDGAREVLDRHLQSLEREDVADGIRALVCWSEDRVCGFRSALVVWDCGV